MEYRKFGDTYVVRMERGEEIIACLGDFCRREKIFLASVQALGAVDRAVVGIYDVEKKQYFKKEFCEPMEICNLCGNVTRKDGEVYLHLHVTLCDKALRAHGGHANELRVSATCEMTVRPLPGQVGRQMDGETGLNLFRFS